MRLYIRYTYGKKSIVPLQGPTLDDPHRAHKEQDVVVVARLLHGFLHV